MTALPDRAPIAIAARPRTLVLSVSALEIGAAMLGPTGSALGGPIRVSRAPESRPDIAIQDLWPQLEPLGEFDRITALTGAGLGDDWDAAIVTRELQRQSFRPVREMSAELRWSQVIRRSRVELVVSIGSELECALFLDGTHVPGLALGRHRFRKGNSYAEYLSPSVLQRKGLRAWNRRLRRAVTEILAVWNPSRLYLAIPDELRRDLDLGPLVEVVGSSSWLDGAVSVWQ